MFVRCTPISKMNILAHRGFGKLSSDRQIAANVQHAAAWTVINVDVYYHSRWLAVDLFVVLALQLFGNICFVCNCVVTGDGKLRCCRFHVVLYCCTVLYWLAGYDSQFVQVANCLCCSLDISHRFYVLIIDAYSMDTVVRASQIGF